MVDQLKAAEKDIHKLPKSSKNKKSWKPEAISRLPSFVNPKPPVARNGCVRKLQIRGPKIERGALFRQRFEVTLNSSIHLKEQAANTRRRRRRRRRAIRRASITKKPQSFETLEGQSLFEAKARGEHMYPKRRQLLSLNMP